MILEKLTLDQQYDVDSRKDQIHLLASRIWDVINEIDYDPMHPQFEHFVSPVKDRIIEFASDVILGFPSLNE